MELHILHDFPILCNFLTDFDELYQTDYNHPKIKLSFFNNKVNKKKIN